MLVSHVAMVRSWCWWSDGKTHLHKHIVTHTHTHYMDIIFVFWHTHTHNTLTHLKHGQCIWQAKNTQPNHAHHIHTHKHIAHLVLVALFGRVVQAECIHNQNQPPPAHTQHTHTHYPCTANTAQTAGTVIFSPSRGGISHKDTHLTQHERKAALFSALCYIPIIESKTRKAKRKENQSPVQTHIQNQTITTL